MLDRLQLPGSFVYYRKIKKIPNNVILECLKLASSGKKGNAIQKIRAKSQVEKQALLISYTMFRVENRPAFLTSGTEMNINYGLAVLIECKEYLVIYKTGTKNFQDELNEYVRKINAKELNGVFLESNSNIEKASGQSIEAKQFGPRKITYEGNNLQTNMPTIGASNRKLSALKHQTNGETYSVSPARSMIAIANTKASLKTYLFKILDGISRFEKGIKPHDFLDNFAESLEFDNYVDKIVPQEIFLHKTDILEFVYGKEDSPRLIYRKPKGKPRYLNANLSKILDTIGDCASISVVESKQERQFQIANKLDRTMKVKVSSKGYRIFSEKFKNVFVELFPGNDIALQSIINNNDFFSITFDKADIHYVEGELMRDNKLLGNINSFLSAFISHNKLKNVNSEKGNLKRNSRKFPQKSIFDFVEAEMISKYDHLILDDLSYEYADYIGIKNGTRVSAIHCKSGNTKFSASSFQEIIGQALKNLHFFQEFEGIVNRKKKWGTLYPKTKIDRIRSNDKNNYIKDLSSTLLSSNCDRQIHLVIDFLSKELLSKNLRALKNGKSSPQSTAPMLWLINSLINTCATRGVKVFIHCKP